MNKNISYGEFNKFDKTVKDRHLIPYSLGLRDRYEKGSHYYSNFNRLTFKVLFVKYYKSGELEGAEIKYEDGTYSYMCTDIDPGYDYKVVKDTEGIYKRDTLVNDGKSYTGAEIIYWFFMHNITCFDRKYKGFWRLVDRYSVNRIDDNCRYILTADVKPNGNYYNCKAIKVENNSSGE